ncbi:hypothetical protein [Desulfolucanica intricata]|uniref:hypothetical protein n=1 Tax=Desulfolucanica intricata TaxID=1285191 RepID=UPI00082C621A|nr:hypothetical protein [Desulfolucanica intricata]
MPRCKNCGNYKNFACSFFSSTAPTANPEPYGLLANFDEQGNLTDMECLGATLDEAQEAFENQKNYFNTCANCGGNDIEW